MSVVEDLKRNLALASQGTEDMKVMQLSNVIGGLIMDNVTSKETLEVCMTHLHQETTVVCRSVSQNLVGVLKDQGGDQLMSKGELLAVHLRKRTIAHAVPLIDLMKASMKAMEDQEDWKGAASTVGWVDFTDSHIQKVMDLHERFEVMLQAAQFYLEDEEPGRALSYIRKLKAVHHKIADPGLRMKYMASSCRVMDYERRFADAAVTYLRISNADVEGISHEDRMTALEKGAVCALLAPAGPNRSRLLSALANDPRIPSNHPLKPLLVSMASGAVVSKDATLALDPFLKDHHKAEVSPGVTLVTAALVQHNLVAVAKVYTSVSFGRLAKLLNFNEKDLEVLIATMTTEKRLKATVDHVRRFVIFQQESALGQADAVIRSALERVSSAAATALTTA